MRMRTLDKNWKELLYSFSGFGPNFLMVMMGAFFTDAINPVAFGANDTYQVIMKGTCFILPALFPILYGIAKAFDGIIDVPFAYITDTLSTKWGRRRPAIVVSFIPMIISYAMCWWPVFGPDNQIGNTIWIIFWALVFFSTYTMCLIAFYGSLSTTCVDEPQRLRVSGYKSFFDTISYCIVYALVPVILDKGKIHIDKFAFICLPLMLTILIPVFMIKEGAKYGYPENDGLKPEKISFKESISLTFKNKMFVTWLCVDACTFFGLQMFLVGMNAMIIGGMGMSGSGMAILNTCAFAPVPLMLYLFNKLKAKKGVRFAYQTCLIAFAIAILGFFFGSKFICGDNRTMQYVIGCIGSLIGSWAIGTFFMMPYLIPSQVSSVEERLTGKNHSAMYFAAQALVTSIIGSISGAVIYENIKMLHIARGCKGVIWAETIQDAASKFGVATDKVFNLGTILVPFIVCFFCLVGFTIMFKLPKDFTPKLVARELKRNDPTLDISSIDCDSYIEPKQRKGEVLFVQIGLSILTGFIFGFIWLGYLLKSLKELINRNKRLVTYLLCCFIPFAQIYFILDINKELKAKKQELGLKYTGNNVVDIIFGCILPIMPLNIVSLAIMQKNVNDIYDKQFEDQIAKDLEAAEKTKETQEVAVNDNGTAVFENVAEVETVVESNEEVKELEDTQEKPEV